MKFEAVIHTPTRPAKVYFSASSLEEAKEIASNWGSGYVSQEEYNLLSDWYEAEGGPPQVVRSTSNGSVVLSLFT